MADANPFGVFPVRPVVSRDPRRRSHGRRGSLLLPSANSANKSPDFLAVFPATKLSLAVIPWIKIAEGVAPDGLRLLLQRRGDEFLIRADGRDLMSSLDDGSSRALARLGCAHIDRSAEARVLVGGLGMGFTLAEALDRVGPRSSVEVAELVPAVVTWNRDYLGDLAGNPLRDPRAILFEGDVARAIARSAAEWDAILLDVDNGPSALAHRENHALYGDRGIGRIARALRPGGVLGLWSFGDDRGYTRRLERAGLRVSVERVEGSRKGRGRRHVIWIAKKPETPSPPRNV